MLSDAEVRELLHATIDGDTGRCEALLLRYDNLDDGARVMREMMRDGDVTTAQLRGARERIEQMLLLHARRDSRVLDGTRMQRALRDARG